MALSRFTVANLLDDLGLGGVTRALKVFETPELHDKAAIALVPVAPGASAPPRLDADLVLVHFPPNWRRLLLLARLRLSSWARGGRVIHVEHSYTGGWEASEVARPARFRLMLAIAVRLVDRVVCVSAAQADWLARVTRMARSRITVIHPHVANAGLAELPLPSRGATLRIGAYGRFSRQKGFDVLIRAFRAGHFPGCTLLLGGFGEDEATLRELADDNPQVIFTGKVSDVASFLRNCDVVAVPSRWEAFGMVATEAREAGRPILVSPVDGLVEQVGSDAAAGQIVDFTDPASIAAALDRCDTATIAAMGQAGRMATANRAADYRREWAGLLREEAALCPKVRRRSR